MLRRSAAVLVLSVLAGFGCSDAAADPPRGNLYIQVAYTDDKPAGTTCPTSGRQASIGNPPPTATNAGKRIEDGDGAEVNCSVKGGNPYSFYAKISQGMISFTMLGNVGAGSNAGTANLVYSDNLLPDTLKNEADKPCNVTVTPDPLQVAKGRIYATFNCSQLRIQPNWYCGASGVFVFENCDE